MSSKDFSQALPSGSVLKGGKYVYTVESVLGKGGFGFTYLVSTVLKVDNIEMTLFFAVKEHFVSSLSSRGSDSHSVESSQPVRVQVEGSLKDFRSEARRLKELSGSSRNIVSVNETFEDNGTAYYVMEFIDGKGLNEIINESGAMSEEHALGLIGPILDAVSVVHNARMTHLDIKPANILVSQDKNDSSLRPVLIDFGLAKHYDSEGHATSTLNTVGCSEGYAPIEQYGGLKTFSPTADVYALGATLFTMLTGTKPRSASDVDSVELDNEMKKHDVSDNTRHVVLKAMEYKSAQRYPSVEAMTDALVNGDSDAVSEATLIIDDENKDNGIVVIKKDVIKKNVIKKGTNKKPRSPKIKAEKKEGSGFNWKLFSLIVLVGIIVGLACFFIIKKTDQSSTFIPEPEYEAIGDYDDVAVEETYRDYDYDIAPAVEEAVAVADSMVDFPYEDWDEYVTDSMVSATDDSYY